MDVDGGQVAWLIAAFGVNLDQQLCSRKLTEKNVDKAVGQMRIDGKAMGGERLETGGEMFADAAHEQQDERVAIASAQLVADALEGIGVQALVGIAELCSEQTNVPGNLHPQHEQGYGCKRTVDGVVCAQLNLIVNVQRTMKASEANTMGETRRAKVIVLLNS